MWLRSWRPVSLALAIMMMGCADHPFEPDTTPSPDAAPFKYGQLDWWPAWSKSRTMVAFWRAYPTSAGPPGIYAVPRTGGMPVLLYPAYWVRDIRFSPDDRHLAAAVNGSLALVDVRRRNGFTAVFTPTQATSPDWSPDGETIVYSRIFSIYEQPPESSGVHFYDVRTGADRVFTSAGAVVFGKYPRFSPDGGMLALVEPTGFGDAIVVYRLADSSKVTVLPAVESSYYDLLEWRVSPASGHMELLYIRRGFLSSFPSGSFALPFPDGPERRTWIQGFMTAVANNGRSVVVTALDPTDSVGVLFVDDMENPGPSRYQLTRWN